MTSEPLSSMVRMGFANKLGSEPVGASYLNLTIAGVIMRISLIWVIEFIKLAGGRRLHPLNAECPFCHQMVRLHQNRAGRRHLLAHARELYEGSRYSVHYSAKAKCLGSGTLAKFNPHPNESLHFKWPKSLDLDRR
jgi:hypothetical protein